ncbi:MAG: YqeG family HAD IIIA-type phosphatase [Bacillota bacterium]|uniref:YqeG family HAD IIIA-type phosphatase n=1 Tax=Desulfurispora thermophila TaxID=265470 RepID=UPI000378CC25|nr:YqeG family HAD IIIA-type phosphatase [Desulfurispora thermophila]
MLNLLFPRQHVASVQQINLAELEKRGIKALLFDLDNTIVPRDQDHLPPEIINFFDRLARRGFKTCLVSNNYPERVGALAGQLGISTVHRAIKPRKKPFLKAMRLLGVTPEQTAVVGDQIFTDILGGNRLGLYTILVTPLPGKEYWATQLISRRLEKIVLALYRRRLASGRR